MANNTKLQSLAAKSSIASGDYLAVSRSDYVEKTISGATQANPVVVTATSHGFNDGDQIYIANVVGMTQLNGNTYTVAGATAHTFQLSGVNGSGYSAYSSGGVAVRGWLQRTTAGAVAALFDTSLIDAAIDAVEADIAALERSAGVNRIRNSQFRIAARSAAPATLANVANNTVVLDGWRVFHDGSGTQVQIANSQFASGNRGQFAESRFSCLAQLKNVTGGGTKRGIALVQVIPAAISQLFDGEDFIAQARATINRLTATGAISPAPTFGIAALKWTSTTDSLSASDCIASWSSNVPTFRTTNHTEVFRATASLADWNASGFPSTPTFSEPWNTGNTNGFVNNLVVVLWVEKLPDGMAWDVSAAHCGFGTTQREFVGNTSEADEYECKRYYRQESLLSIAFSNTFAESTALLAPTMRATPTGAINGGVDHKGIGAVTGCSVVGLSAVKAPTLTKAAGLTTNGQYSWIVALDADIA